MDKTDNPYIRPQQEMSELKKFLIAACIVAAFFAFSLIAKPASEIGLVLLAVVASFFISLGWWNLLIIPLLLMIMSESQKP